MRTRGIGAVVLALAGAPAHAAVEASSPSSFAIRHEFTIEASRDAAWRALVKPGRWWPKAHTWSGDPSNLALDPVAGGCYCERWRGGSAEHGRVIMARAGELLRLDAPLGPLQSMALSAVLTVELADDGEGTKATLTFRASGDASHALDQLAPVVDRVVGEQFGRWVVYARDGRIEP